MSPPAGTAASARLHISLFGGAKREMDTVDGVSNTHFSVVSG